MLGRRRSSQRQVAVCRVYVEGKAAYRPLLLGETSNDVIFSSTSFLLHKCPIIQYVLWLLMILSRQQCAWAIW